MRRPTRQLGILVATLLLTTASYAHAQWQARVHPPREDGSDGAWNKRYWYTTGAFPVTNPVGVVFDPSRAELIHFSSDRITFKNIDSAGPSRVVRIGGWPGIPLGCSAIYDPRRDRIVVMTLAKRGGSSGLVVDVFALRLGGPIQWERLVPAGTSPSLFHASAVYDPVRDCMLVYGGADPFSVNNEVRGDVWALSLGDDPRWTALEPRGVPPPLRTGNTAIYEAAHREMIVYGGRAAADGGLLGDVWALDLGPQPRWRQIKVGDEAPASRAGHAAIYDAHRERMLVIGWQRDNYVWALSLRGVPRWSRLDPSGEAPPGGNGQIAFADADRDRMVLMDGDGWWLWTLDWGRRVETPVADDKEMGLSSGRGAEAADGTPLALELPSTVWRGGAFNARVSLCGPSGARLDLFDVAGRRIWSSGPDELGLGPHDVMIAPPGTAPRGVYFLRLDQSARSITRKIVRLP